MNATATRLVLPPAVLACGLAMSIQARATVHLTDAQSNQVAFCQSSLPTSDAQYGPRRPASATKARPRARS